MSGKFGVFNNYRMWKKGDFINNPTVHIALNHFGKKNGVVIITESLASNSEIDNAIDKLVTDLEKSRKEAKKTLLAQKRKMERAHEK